MKKFYDFVGNEITLGSYVAYPSGGNVKAEYGMILYKISGFDFEKGKLKARRIHVNMGQGKDYSNFPPLFLRNAMLVDGKREDHFRTGYFIDVKYSIRWSESTIENVSKMAVVNLPEKTKTIFEKVLSLDKSVFSEVSVDDLSAWLLGSLHSKNLNPFH